MTWAKVHLLLHDTELLWLFVFSFFLLPGLLLISLNSSPVHFGFCLLPLKISSNVLWSLITSSFFKSEELKSLLLFCVHNVEQVVKNLPANAQNERDEGLIPGSGRSPAVGNGNPLQYSCLGNSMEKGNWRAIIHGVTKSWTQLSNYAHTCTLVANLCDTIHCGTCA